MKAENYTQDYLLVNLAGKMCAINISKVYQILELQTITKVPQMPSFILGFMSARGGLLPVIDLRLLYGMEATAQSKHTAIIATKYSFESENGEKSQEVGLLVDAVLEVTNIDDISIKQPTVPGKSGNMSFFTGFVTNGNDIIIVLDIDHLLSTDKITQLTSLSFETSLL